MYTEFQVFKYPYELWLLLTNTYDADSAAHRLRGQVLPELGADTTAVAMGTSHLTPDDTEVVLLDVARGRCQSGDKST